MAAQVCSCVGSMHDFERLSRSWLQEMAYKEGESLFGCHGSQTVRVLAGDSQCIACLVQPRSALFSLTARMVRSVDSSYHECCGLQMWRWTAEKARLGAALRLAEAGLGKGGRQRGNWWVPATSE